jgi:hypothetical protein
MGHTQATAGDGSKLLSLFGHPSRKSLHQWCSSRYGSAVRQFELAATPQRSSVEMATLIKSPVSCTADSAPSAVLTNGTGASCLYCGAQRPPPPRKAQLASPPCRARCRFAVAYDPEAVLRSTFFPASVRLARQHQSG